MPKRDPNGVRTMVRAALARLFPSAHSGVQPPTLRQTLEEPEIITETDVDASQPSVQTTPQKPGVALVKVTHKEDPSWVWTKTKREALRLTVDGVPIGVIAERTGRHRNTIREWWGNPFFAAEVRLRTAEQNTSRKLRAPHRAGVLAETLFQKSVKVLADSEKTGKLDVGQAGLVLREARDWQRAESEAIGAGAVQRIEHRHLFEGSPDGDMGSAKAKTNEGLMKFLEGYDPKLTEGLSNAKTQDELVEAMRKVAMETPIVDVIQEASREEVREDDKAHAEAHRKR